jgi:hypothetical protein
VARRRDKDFVTVGKRNSNPLLDTREYEVQLSDGMRQCVSANLITESILSQVDNEGNSFAIIKDIINHRKDDSAVDKENGETIGKGGQGAPENYDKRMGTRGRVARWHLVLDLTERFEGVQTSHGRGQD